MIAALASSKSDRWFTPSEYVDAARACLGVIDLDPASELAANETVKAQRIFTRADDGLARAWHASTVFCNPPYGRSPGVRSVAGVFAFKMISEFQVGHFGAGILLVNASTSEEWFKPLFDFPICFTDHRIHFVGNGNSPTKGSAFVLMGGRLPLFKQFFSPFGNIVGRLA